MGITVLVVDDSLTICQLLCAQLAELGVGSVDQCHSGEEALAMIVAHPDKYDCVFLDLHLGGMDGLELMHQLHNNHFSGGIVVISGLDRKIIDFTLEVVSNYNLRVLGSVPKPFDRALLSFMVRRISSYYPVHRRSDKLLPQQVVVDAIQNKQVLAYFQPKISSVDNSLIGIECLTRLQPPQGVVSPASFISVAENYKLIDSLTAATLNVALPAYREFCAQIGREVKLAINISPLQLYETNLHATLHELLQEHYIAVENIVLEITENHALRDDRQLKNLNRLRIHGYELSLDDYGAGYTSLRQIEKLPFNEIKLDAQLVNGIHNDKVLQTIVRSIRSITHQLKLTLVAEGVADSRDLLHMNDIGVDAYQGYLFCRPKPANELVRWHKAWQKSVANINQFSAS